MKKIVFLAGLITAGVTLFLITGWLAGPGEADAATGPEVVYLCRETQQLVTAPAQPTPAVNPETGRATLYRALYCRPCGRWHAVAPSAVSGGNPMSNLCPRHRQPMSAEGPLDATPAAR